MGHEVTIRKFLPSIHIHCIYGINVRRRPNKKST